MDIQIGAQVKIINPDDTAEYGVEVGDEGVVVWIGEYASYGVCIPKKSDVYAYALNDLEVIKPFQVPEGFVLIKDDTKTVVAIERMVEQQVEASGMDSRRLERLDGWKIIEAAAKAQEPAK